MKVSIITKSCNTRCITGFKICNYSF